MRRTFGIEIVCSKCKSQLRPIALIKSENVAKKILKPMHLPPRPSRRARAYGGAGRKGFSDRNYPLRMGYAPTSITVDAYKAGMDKMVNGGFKIHEFYGCGSILFANALANKYDADPGRVAYGQEGGARLGIRLVARDMKTVPKIESITLPGLKFADNPLASGSAR